MRSSYVKPVLSRLSAAPILLVSLLVMAACATGPRIFTDSNPAANFAAYQTFTWVGDNPLISAPPGFNPLSAQRIQTEIVAVLAAKGYRQAADAEAADIAVGYTVGLRDKVKIDSFPSTYRGDWGWGRRHWGYYPDYDVQATTRTEGQLAIDFFDVASKQPVWHGVASKNVHRSDQDNPGPVIKEAVAALLAEFPDAAQ